MIIDSIANTIERYSCSNLVSDHPRDVSRLATAIVMKSVLPLRFFSSIVAALGCLHTNTHSRFLPCSLLCFLRCPKVIVKVDPK